MHSSPGAAGIVLLLGACAFGHSSQASQSGAAYREPSAVAIGGLAVPQRDAAKVRVDGRLDEAVWRDLAVYDDFRLIDPDTLAPGPLPTRLRLFYTKRGLYAGVDMAQDPATLVEHLSGRDQFLNRDFFSITLDTSGEGRYGFWFQLSLGDSVSDGTVLPERQFSSSWDGAWRGASARTERGWSAEFFVPWSLVSMPKANGQRTIGIFAQRNVAHADERYAWPPLPWSKPKFLSALQPLALRDVDPRQQYGVTPYLSGNYDRLAGGGAEPRAGVDLFWRPSSNLQIAATLNPDFGNVEADDVVVNLSNYETFFPEKRLFFQEGQEIFNLGDKNMRLLHTRRIGAPAMRPNTPEGIALSGEGLSSPADLVGAVKATGQRGSLRYGFLGVAEDDTNFAAYHGDAAVTVPQQGRNFGALRVLYERANGGYRSVGFLSTAVRHPQRSASVYAMDGRVISAAGRVRANALLVASDVDGSAEDGFGGALDFGFTPRQGQSHSLSLQAFDESVQLNDMGFHPRNDYRRVAYRLRLSKPDFMGFRNTRTYVRWARMWNTAGKVIGSRFSVDQRVTLDNLSQLSVSGDLWPASYDDRGSFGNGAFRVDDGWEVELEYESDSARRMSYSLSQRWRAETIGDGVHQRTQGAVRWRPTDRLSMGLALHYSQRPSWLLHRSQRTFAAFAADQLIPNFDLSYFFTSRQQLRMAFQWVAIQADESAFYRIADESGQLLPWTRTADAPSEDFAISRMNLQLRYRWEIAPLSDLFVVYTRNAAASYDEARDRGFGGLFSSTVASTTGENLAVKLRYRFGS